MKEKDMYENLIRVSTYAKRINKSTELVRLFIRSGKFTLGKEYVIIDGVTFIDTDNAKLK